MENTLQVDDRVAVNKVPFLSREIKRGDVVVFRDPANWLPNYGQTAEPFVIAKAKEALVAVGILPNPAKQYLVKRVIGVAGDNVVGKDGVVTINGKATTEPYIFAGNKASELDFNITVPAGKVWVMGDHRGASADSRFHPDSANQGMVPLSKVVGRATFIVWPFGNIAFIPKGEDLKRVQVKVTQ